MRFAAFFGSLESSRTYARRGTRPSWERESRLAGLGREEGERWLNASTWQTKTNSNSAAGERPTSLAGHWPPGLAQRLSLWEIALR